MQSWAATFASSSFPFFPSSSHSFSSASLISSSTSSPAKDLRLQQNNLTSKLLAGDWSYWMNSSCWRRGAFSFLLFDHRQISTSRPSEQQSDVAQKCANFQFSTLHFQFSTSEDGSLTERRGWWCQSSFFVDLASHLCSREMTKKFYNQVVHSQAVLLAWVFPNHNHRSDVVKVQNLKRKVVNVKIIAIPSPSPQRPTQARPRPDSPLCQRKVIFVFRISILTNHHRQNTNIQRGKALTTTIERPARRTYYDWHTAWQTQME